MSDIVKTESDALLRGPQIASEGLRNIPFVEFTTGLVRDVLRTLIDSSIEQLEAYSELVATVAGGLSMYQGRFLGSTPTEIVGTVDQYIRDVLGESIPSGDFFSFTDDKVAAVKSHLNGVTISRTLEPDSGEGYKFVAISPAKAIDDIDIEAFPLGEMRSFVYEKLKREAQISYDKLIAILQLGFQRIIFKDFMIESAITFHIDTKDTYSRAATTTESSYSEKASGWAVKGGFNFSSTLKGGRKTSGKLLGGIVNRTFGGFISGGYSSSQYSNQLTVAVVNEKSTAATNVSVDIIGRVRIEGRSDFFPAYIPEADGNAGN